MDRARSDLLALVSHELRTPLTSIRGSVDLLKRRSDLPEETVETLIETAARCADRLARRVDDLLAAAGMDEGTILTEVDIADIVSRSSHTHLKADARARVSIVPRRLVIKADAAMVERAVDHLIDNALKFSSPEGRIIVRAEQIDNFAHLMISNEGPHIPAEDRERIFERFVILDDINTRENPGTGLGLFIVRGAIELAGGQVWVESEPGRGVTFHVMLPLAQTAPASDGLQVHRAPKPKEVVLQDARREPRPWRRTPAGIDLSFASSS